MSIHEDWGNPEAPKRGMSTTVKVLLIVGAIGGFFLLLCCGGVGVVLWKAKDVIEQVAVTTDPDEIRTRAAGIAQIEIPPGFAPSRGFELGFMRWAGYEKTPPDGSRFLLMEFDGAMFPDKTLPEQRREMEKMFDQPGSGFARFDMPITVSDRSTREITVRGESVEFEFNKGTSSDGKPLRQAVGAFKTSRGTTLFNLIVPEEGYDEAAVVRMIESIRDPILEVDDDDEPEQMSGDDANPAAGGEQPAQETPAKEDSGEKSEPTEPDGSTSN